MPGSIQFIRLWSTGKGPLGEVCYVMAMHHKPFARPMVAIVAVNERTAVSVSTHVQPKAVCFPEARLLDAIRVFLEPSQF